MVTTEELGLDAATDDVHLLAAAQAGRILLTHNKKDFLLLHHAWRGWTRAWGIDPSHAGIVVPLQDWLPEREIEEIDASLRSAEAFTNEFVAWERDARTWVRRP